MIPLISLQEIETGMEKVYFGEEENRELVLQACTKITSVLTPRLAHEYVRPLSRAAVTALMRAYATPSIAI